MIILFSVIFGVILGFLWINVGGWLSDYYSNFLSWFIFPLIPIFLMSTIAFLLNNNAPFKTRIRKSVFSMVWGYGAYLIPFAVSIFIFVLNS